MQERENVVREKYASEMRQVVNENEKMISQLKDEFQKEKKKQEKKVKAKNNFQKKIIARQEVYNELKEKINISMEDILMKITNKLEVVVSKQEKEKGIIVESIVDVLKENMFYIEEVTDE